MENNEEILTAHTRGWVIINREHPNKINPFVSLGSFRTTKKQCINDFIYGSSKTWDYWKRIYNFRCVRAEQIIQTLKTQ